MVQLPIPLILINSSLTCRAVSAQCKKPTAQMAHLVFSDTRANAQKTKRAIFFQRSDRRTERNSNIFYIEKRDIGK
jgi:hypothetical protein